MINLLPPEQKKGIMYARRNTRLRKWIAALSFVLVGMFIFLAAGQLYLANATKRYETRVASAKETLKAQQLEETEKRLEGLSNNLKLIVQVLSRQILFSKLMRQVGASMPTGSVLQSLELSKVEGGIDLKAKATDYDTATRIQVNLQDPKNKIFDKVDIIQVTCAQPSPSNEYPCTVTLRALFGKNNQFLFINNGANR